MSLLIALAFCGGLIYMLAFSCTFNNHDYDIIERDEGYDCHRLKCAKCGHERRHDPYEGICG